MKMDAMTYQINSLSNDVKRLITVVEHLAKDTQSSSTQEHVEQKYYTLKDAVKLKYGENASYTSISTNYALMPCCNSHYVICGGKRMWNKELIEEWLDIQDKDIPEYAQKYGVSLVGKIGEKYKKYM